MKILLLERYHQACKEANLLQHERLQDNEFIHVITAWLEDWTDKVRYEREMAMTITEWKHLLDLRSEMLETI